LNEVSSMQNWVKRRYIKLLSELKNKEFSFQEAVEVLSKFFGDGDDQVKNILSELKKAGLLYV